ncbi:alpha/beta hydrolase [Streptomyces plumbiresistens]|uniref:AB hydrolase-1 domain-containing protein n=1 Tax=Streptomyces plumbiresistens TaxID=511811 RepID=A0ABP7TFF0_9ACTN
MTQTPGAVFRTATVPAGEYTLNYAEAGPAEPTATIISLPGSAGLEMSTAKDALAERYRVIEINPPGWGDRDDVRTRFHQSELGPLLVEAINQLVDGPFYVLGTSLGGTNALYVASLLPDQVLGVILDASMAPILPSEDLREAPSSGPAPEEGEYPLPEPHPRKPWGTKEVIARQMANRLRLFNWIEPDMQATSAIATIADRKIPVLALLGDKDEILHAGQEQRFREQLPHARFHLIEEGTHDLQNTAPETFVALVKEFIAPAARG